MSQQPPNPDADLSRYYNVTSPKTSLSNRNFNSSELNSDDIKLSKHFLHIRDHIILCSLRNLGYRILEQLLEAKIPVIVIDDDPDPRFARLAQRHNVPFIHEDSRLAETLEIAGIERARAVITVNDNDLHNLETVLAANELVNGIRTIASFFNTEIGQQLVQAVPNTQALDLSELAAPVFVNATIPSNVLHRFHIQKEELVVVDADPQITSTIGQLYPNSTALLLRNLSSQEAETHQMPANAAVKAKKPKPKPTKNIVCPPPNVSIEAGDHIALIGPVQHLRGLEGVRLSQSDLEQDATHIHVHPKTNRRRNIISSFSRIFGNLVGEIERPFRITLAGLLLIIIFSTVFFTLVYHSDTIPSLNPLEALYFTITIITTIGFGDISLLHQHWWVILFGITLELIGATSLAILYAFLTNFIVSRRIEQSLGIQRATDMQNHVIVTGLDNVGFGYRVVEGLVARGQSVIVMERDDQNRFVPLVRALGVMVIFGDSRLQESLRRVNISKASCIVMVSNDDMLNLETALAARSQLKNIRVVLRLFDRSLADKIEQAFGIEIASSTSAVSAPSFIAAALNYEVITSFYIRKQVFIVARLKIVPNSPLQGKSSEWLYQYSGVRILAYIAAPRKISTLMEGEFMVRELDPVFHPNPALPFQPEDTIYFVGPYDRIIQVHQLNTLDA